MSARALSRRVWVSFLFSALAALVLTSQVWAGALPPVPFPGGEEPTPGDLCEVSFCPSPARVVAIDIKPDDEMNCVNNDGHGVIPVIIYGSATFDSTRVIVQTVRLEGLAVNAAGKSGKLQTTAEDANHDGFVDLQVQIEDVDGTFSAGSGWATLTALTVDFSEIIGFDMICVVR